jgi:hypothetical protein
VELRRVLRGQHEERPGQFPLLALDGHLRLLHHLEQRRLRARRGAVDLVGQEHVGEDRALAELEGAVLRAVEAAAGDVGRQQVRRELHPAEHAVDAAGQALGQRGLAGARYVLQQHVAAGQHGHEHEPDALRLAADHGGQVVLDALHVGGEGGEV